MWQTTSKSWRWHHYGISRHMISLKYLRFRGAYCFHHPETSVEFCEITRHNIPGDCPIHTRRRENLKFYLVNHDIRFSSTVDDWRVTAMTQLTIGATKELRRMVSEILCRTSAIPSLVACVQCGQTPCGISVCGRISSYLCSPLIILMNEIIQREMVRHTSLVLHHTHCITSTFTSFLIT
jgi:hypothetical protein